MAITEADGMRRLAIVRRLEAAGFRAYPATTTRFDGTWAVRLTEGFAAKRLNSVNPLDPGDHVDIERRIERVAERFQEYGRPLLIRQSPLAPKPLCDHLDRKGWTRFGEAIVLTADLGALDLRSTIDRIPVRDPARYVNASLKLHGRPDGLKAGLIAILESIRPPTGLFVQEAPGETPIAVALTVQDNDLVGVLDVAVAPEMRGRTIGRDLLTTALRYALHKGARTGWLQVDASNSAALALYRRLGFTEAYRSVYRAPPA